ncbi:hypothetical protein ACU4HD_14955 [Cupriavidus basilensis]
MVRDACDEARSLITLKMRNGRWTNDPLADDFVSGLFDPAIDARVFSYRHEWRTLLNSLRELLERARASHWGSLLATQGVWRRVYDWQSREAHERWDYPAWAHRAATNLMLRGGSIFQHAGTAGPDTGNLLFLAHSWTGARGKVSDSQVLATLAMREATAAARALVRAVQAVSDDPSVSHWLNVAQKPEWQRREVRVLLDEDINTAIDRALLDCFYPELDYMTRHRIHAEQLLLLADVVATGSLLGKDAGQVLTQLAKADAMRQAAEDHARAVQAEQAAEAAARKEVGRKQSELMRAGRLKVTPEVASAIQERSDELMKENPAILAKTRYADVARHVNEKLGRSGNRAISARTVQRNLAPKD